MLRILRKTTLFAAALVTSLGLFASSANAQGLSDCPPEAVQGAGLRSQGMLHHNQLNCRPQTWGSPELFYNYYVPGTCGGISGPIVPGAPPRPRLCWPHLLHVSAVHAARTAVPTPPQVLSLLQRRSRPDPDLHLLVPPARAKWFECRVQPLPDCSLVVRVSSFVREANQ